MARLMLPAARIAAGFCMLFLLVPASADAQEIPTFEGEEVTVPGKRPQLPATTPAFVTVLTREELGRLGFTTLGEALQFLAEVSVRTAGPGLGGFQQASIRGSTPQQVLVLLDGVPLNSTAQFGVNLSTIPLDEVERVEVLRGPYSAIYGNALGGVVSIRLRHEERTRLTLAGGTSGTWGGALRLGRAWSGGRLSLGGEYGGTAGDRPNSDASRWTGTLRLALEYTPQRSFTLTAYHAAGETGLPGPTFFPTPGDRLVDTRSLLTLNWSAEAAGRTTQTRLWWLDDRLAERAPGFTSDDRGQSLGSSWQRVLPLAGRTMLTLGIEAERVSFTSSSTFASFAGEGTSAAGYAQYDTLLGGRTLLGVGVRLESHSGYGPQVNPRLGFVRFLGERVRLRGGVGRTFRAPTFFELAYPGCSNPGLRPEQAWAADLGVEAAPRPGLALRLNGFYTDARDLIIGGCDPQNVGSARVAGLSAEIAARVATGWTLNGNLTWTDGVDRTTGLRLLRVAPLQANLALQRTVGEGAAVSLLLNYVSARDDLDTSMFPAPRITLPAYSTVGLRYERRVGPLLFTAGVDNLLDAQYETVKGFPAAGRTFFFRVGSSL